VTAKLERAEYSRTYKDAHENQDAHEMEKVVEDALQTALPEEGQEQLTENEKVMVGIKARFQTLTRCFFAPELNATKVKAEHKDKVKTTTERGATLSQHGSVASGGDASYNYIPLAPEQWQDKVRDLKNVYVLKYPKIIQALFYLLQYQPRE
jgi:hypothetical protein